MFLKKVTTQIALNKFLWSKYLKMLCRGHMLLMILMEKNMLGLFSKNNCKNQIKSALGQEKLSRNNWINYMLNEKDTIICLTTK